MVDSLNLRNLIWLLVSLVEVLFLLFLLAQRRYRSFPFFAVYVESLVLQTVAGALVYRGWGATSRESWAAAWYSQTAVVGARWLAVSEVARKVFVRYSGVWRLVGGILATLAISILLYSLVVSGVRFDVMVLAADRRVELFIAVFVVAMFVFARYYRLPIGEAERQLAIGFCLYSCVWVINNTLFEAWRRHWLDEIWDIVQTMAFLATVAIWFMALRAPPAASAVERVPTVSPEMYAQLSQEVNSRLLTLNSRLNHLFRSEDSGS